MSFSRRLIDGETGELRCIYFGKSISCGEQILKQSKPVEKGLPRQLSNPKTDVSLAFLFIEKVKYPKSKLFKRQAPAALTTKQPLSLSIAEGSKIYQINEQ